MAEGAERGIALPGIWEQARRDGGWLAACLLPMVMFPQIDLTISGWFYRAGQGFPLSRLPFFLFVMQALPILLIGAVLVAIALAAFGAFRHKLVWGIAPRHALFLALSLALGPGLLVNTLFKDHWGRARPSQIMEFGGLAHFTPPLMMTDQCTRNCSFPAGHPALAFWLVAFAFLVPVAWKRPTLLAAVTIGILVGSMRMAMGGHFFSDVVASGLLVYGVTRWLDRAILHR